MAGSDSNFETNAAEIIGLYLNSLEHAAVFCVDEKTAIQALDRLDRVLPPSPGRIERHTVSSITGMGLSLYAALETATDRVHGKTSSRHTSQDLAAFLEEVVAHCSARQQIHIILDNLSAHKTRLVDEFLQNNPLARFHFTPTYSSWRNQVELWFGKIERDLMARVPSPLSLTWPARSRGTSRLTQTTPDPFSGSTQTQNVASAVTISLPQATSSAG